MRSLVKTALILSLMIAGITAQKSCSSDADCGSTQYCYNYSTCANYTTCSWYNRLESSEGAARSATQCGSCKKGYIAGQNQDGEADYCNQKDPSVKTESVSNGTEILQWVIPGVLLVIALMISVVVWFYRDKLVSLCNDNKRPETPTAGSYIPRPSAPPSSPRTNNHNFNDAANNNLLPHVGEHRVDIRGDESALVKAKAFHPPHYVRVPNPSYNPGDNLDQNQTISPSDVDDETMSSDWTPAGQPNPMSSQSFGAAITELQNPNEGLVNGLQICPPPLPSTTQQDRENNNSTGPENSGGGAGRTGNTTGNSSGPVINISINQQQFQINHPPRGS